MKVFFSVPVADADNVCECGLKVSEYGDRMVTVNGREMSFVSAYLNPNDAEKDDGRMIIRLIPDDAHCYIAEGSFYEEHMLCIKSGGDDFWLKKYQETIIPAAEYKFGMYRKPEYLIGRTLFSDQIEKFDRRKGEPILYNNSKELYIGSAVRYAEESCEDFYETAVSAVHAENGLKYIDGQMYKIFIDKDENTVFITKK